MIILHNILKPNKMSLEVLHFALGVWNLSPSYGPSLTNVEDFLFGWRTPGFSFFLFGDFVSKIKYSRIKREKKSRLFSIYRHLATLRSQTAILSTRNTTQQQSRALPRILMSRAGPAFRTAHRRDPQNVSQLMPHSNSAHCDSLAPFLKQSRSYYCTFFTIIRKI